MNPLEDLESIIKVEPSRFEDESIEDNFRKVEARLRRTTESQNIDNLRANSFSVNEDFKTSEKIRKESVRLKYQGPYYCDYCGGSCKSHDTLKYHFRLMHGFKHDFLCFLCLKTFVRKKMLTDHVNTIHLKKKKLHCKSCAFITFRTDALKRHHQFCHHCKKIACRQHVQKKVCMVKPDLNLELTCRICDKTMCNKKVLQNHITVHNSKKCGKCELVVERHQMHQHNLKNHFEGRLYFCHCERVFRFPQALKYHKQLHENLEIDCPLCDRKFRTEVSLYCHWKTGHRKTHGTLNAWKNYLKGVKDGNVTNIPANFGARKNLVINRYGPFTCDSCGYVSKSRNKFMEHFKHHFRPFFYCDLCPQISKTKYNLGKHMRAVHLRSRPFSCLICNHKTFTEFNLNKHMLTHRSKRKCKICDKLVTDLEVHLRNVHLKSRRKTN